MTKTFVATSAALALLVGGAAVAQQSSHTLLTTLPNDATTVTNYYKQGVYDPSDNKIGEITDLLVQTDGKIPAAMVGVGGFLGMGEKDVAVPFDALKPTMKNNKMYLVMNTTKDALKSAPGYKYDRTATKWIPDTSSPAKTQ